MSRHLRLLCDAGLLVRFREEHWVYYRTPTAGVDARRCASCSRDSICTIRSWRAIASVRCACAQSAPQLPPGVGTSARHRRIQVRPCSAALLEELGTESIGDLLDIGTGTGRILRWLAPRATQAVGVDLESDAFGSRAPAFTRPA